MSELVDAVSSQLGGRLLAERTRLGLTQEEFASLGGVKPGAQYLYEKGKRSPSADYLVRLATQGVDISFVLGLRDIPSNKMLGVAERRIYIEEVVNFFSQADRECRDREGTLFDYGYRVKRFKSLVTDYFLKDRK